MPSMLKIVLQILLTLALASFLFGSGVWDDVYVVCIIWVQVLVQ